MDVSSAVPLNISCACWYNLMGLVCLYQATKGRHLQLMVIHCIVCNVAALCAMVYYINISNKYAKYIEWTICTPLIVVEVSIINRMEFAKMVSVFVLTMTFCLCGIVAAFNTNIIIKSIVAGQGIVYSIYVLVQLWTVSLATRVGILYMIFTSMIWPLYVMVWSSGPHMFMMITEAEENMIENILSLAAKTTTTVYIMTLKTDGALPRAQSDVI